MSTQILLIFNPSTSFSTITIGTWECSNSPISLCNGGVKLQAKCDCPFFGFTEDKYYWCHYGQSLPTILFRFYQRDWAALLCVSVYNKYIIDFIIRQWYIFLFFILSFYIFFTIFIYIFYLPTILFRFYQRDWAGNWKIILRGAFLQRAG